MSITSLKRLNLTVIPRVVTKSCRILWNFTFVTRRQGISPNAISCVPGFKLIRKFGCFVIFRTLSRRVKRTTTLLFFSGYLPIAKRVSVSNVYLGSAYVVRRAGNVLTGVCLSICLYIGDGTPSLWSQAPPQASGPRSFLVGTPVRGYPPPPRQGQFMPQAVHLFRTFFFFSQFTGRGGIPST